MIHKNGSKSQLNAHGIYLKEGTLKELFEEIRTRIYFKEIDLHKFINDERETRKLTSRFQDMYQQVGDEMISLIFPERLRSEWLLSNIDKINKCSSKVWIESLDNAELTEAQIKKAFIFSVVLDLKQIKDYQYIVSTRYSSYLNSSGVTLHNKNVKLARELLKTSKEKKLFTREIIEKCKKTLLKKFEDEPFLCERIETL